MIDYTAEIDAATELYPSVPPSWIFAFIGTETSFEDPPVTWEANVGEYSYGPMQVLLSTARGLGFSGSADQLQDPATNIQVGTADIAGLIALYGMDFDRVYSAYNSGRPDAYLTSNQVASNVARAQSWLSQYVEPVESLAGVGLLVAVGLLWLHFRAGQRRQRR